MYGHFSQGGIKLKEDKRVIEVLKEGRCGSSYKKLEVKYRSYRC